MYAGGFAYSSFPTENWEEGDTRFSIDIVPLRGIGRGGDTCFSLWYTKKPNFHLILITKQPQ
jgi:hypothetical protein